MYKNQQLPPRKNVEKSGYNQKNTVRTPAEKPRVATVYPPEEGKKRMVLAVPGKNVYEVVVMSHERLSVLRKWSNANGYRLDESRLNAPKRKTMVKWAEDTDFSYYADRM